MRLERASVLAVGLLLGAGLVATLRAGDSEENKIEAVIAAVIEAYRSGNTAAMERYYAPEVSFIPADYNPPVQGWATVAQRYQVAFSQLSGMELLRENTRIERRGKFAWAVYQWRFAGLMGDQAMGAQGHTTLILEKRGRDWVIVHNHTSAIPSPPVPEPSPATQPSPPGR